VGCRTQDSRGVRPMTCGGATCVPDCDKVEDSEEFILAGRDFEIVEAEILPGLYVDSRPAV